MKFNKYAIIAATVLSLTGASCSDYLDKEVDLTLQAENVFADYDRTRGFLALLYDYLPDAFVGYNDTQYRLSNDCMTDNAVSYWGVHRYHSVNADAYDATNHWFADYYWERRYTGIRGCNQFILNARADVVGNSEKSGDDNRLYDRWIAEARVLRAICHFDLICWFGDIPVVADDEEGTPIILTPSSTLPERVSAKEALQWVIDECDKYKDDLPFRYSNEEENWGRINGAAAYALKARAALYLASPLYNTSGDTQLWSNAAQYALDFINKNQQCSNPYRLYTTSDNDTSQNYYQCFVTDPVRNNEYILSRSVWSTLNLEYFNAPCGFSGSISATGYLNPTQNLVDAYETLNGLPIDQDPTYDDQNPYVNRDPRLEQTIFHQGTVWGDTDEERTIDVSNDEYGKGIDYARGNGGTATGYYSKKYTNNIRWDGTIGNQRHACPIFRYGEILLNAAEALNEAGRTSEAYQYVNQVRARVGMPAYKSMDQSTLRERIRNERRIELCFEDHRYFDERRWKLFTENKSASAETSLPRYRQVYNLYGVSVRKTDADGTSVNYVYGTSDVDSRVSFTIPKNYFFPIPYDELIKTGYPQTPGWEL
jgi:hypothetical protein